MSFWARRSLNYNHDGIFEILHKVLKAYDMNIAQTFPPLNKSDSIADRLEEKPKDTSKITNPSATDYKAIYERINVPSRLQGYQKRSR